MAYTALTLNLLISAPGDIPEEDLSVIRRTITQWNVSIGRAFAVTVLPISWTDHAVSQFGARPQAAINSQLVDSADMGLALFNRRLGTRTGKAESGTAEEIVVMAEAGKPVSILRNRSAQPPLKNADEIAEQLRLEEYLTKEVFHQALVLAYQDAAELVQHVNNMLSLHTSAYRQRVEDAKIILPDDLIGVWPRVEVDESTGTDQRGRIKTKRHWYLVLDNATGRPVYDVTYRFDEKDSNFDLGNRERDPLTKLPPGGSARYPLFVSLQSAEQADCIVTWHDSAGVEHESMATVRL